MMFCDSRCTAERLAERLLTFSRGTSKQTGQAFYVVPASNCLSAHWTAIDGSGCTCLGFQQRGTCTHQLACLPVLGQHTNKRTWHVILKQRADVGEPVHGA